ncbi:MULTISPECIES: hypothetical protein [Bacillus cereus group]|uniref:hypothetical protein n=1 Tax=Bacillus cereus group TaxID=86661 RepID=UPI000BFCC66D|nr:hypothetical protein [Bacillus thuringiensis]PGX99692.1 hypothetical protein COE39_02865 [Bacillus thuringiensis]
MKRQNVSSAIGALTTLFYVHQDTYLGIKTLEFYVELGLLENASLVAEVLEETRSCDLIHAIKLFDMPTAERIENILRGV